MLLSECKKVVNTDVTIVGVHYPLSLFVGESMMVSGCWMNFAVEIFFVFCNFVGFQ